MIMIADKNDVLGAFERLTGYVPTEGGVQPWNKGGLRFTHSGAARLASIAAWITCLKETKVPSAAASESIEEKGHDGGKNYLHGIGPARYMATNLAEYFTTLDEYGGREEVDYKRSTYQGTKHEGIELPRYLVELGDDGTLHSFTLMYYLLQRHDEAKRRLARQKHYVTTTPDGEKVHELDYPDLSTLDGDPRSTPEHYKGGCDYLPWEVRLTHGYYRSINGGLIFHHESEEWGTHH